MSKMSERLSKSIARAGKNKRLQSAGKSLAFSYLAGACAAAAAISACMGVVEPGDTGEAAGSSSSAGANDSAGTGTTSAGTGGAFNAGGMGGPAGSPGFAGSPTGMGGTFGNAGNPGTSSGNGLSCEMNRVLTTCLGCHGVTPGLKPMSSRQDLLAASVEQPGKRIIDVAVQRVRDTALPMPPKPAPALSAADVAVLNNWLSSGTPTQSCGTDGAGGSGGAGRGGTGSGGTNGGGGRGGSGGRGGMSAGGGGGTTAVVCTSKTNWTNGNGPNMRPGNACRSCHNFVAAGTIYPTAHEPTNCNGVNGSTGVRIVITGANGTKVTLTPGSTGNFYTSTRITTPYTVTVTNGTATRSMLTPQTSGDCNSCHTQNGANGAPGRIMVP